MGLLLHLVHLLCLLDLLVHIDFSLELCSRVGEGEPFSIDFPLELFSGVGEGEPFSIDLPLELIS